MLPRRVFSGQEGSVSIAVIAVAMLSLLMCLCVTDAGLMLAARSQAQNAADAAALAAAQESFPLLGTGRTPRSAASRTAGENGAALKSISISGGGGRVQVDVSVRVPSIVLQRLGVGPQEVTAAAAAEVDIERLLAHHGVWYTADPALYGKLASLLSASRPGDPAAASTTVALLALGHLGKPYVFGAAGPNAFDCSGLVCFVFAQVGVRLPRVTFSQVRCGTAVPAGALLPGDLVFFRSNGHVGIYLGGGWYVHAPRTGDVVKVSPLSARSDISACRRIL